MPIPGNDDGIRSIEVIIRHLADAVIAGTKNLKVNKEKESSEAAAEAAAAAAADKDAGEEASTESAG